MMDVDVLEPGTRWSVTQRPDYPYEQYHPRAWDSIVGSVVPLTIEGEMSRSSHPAAWARVVAAVVAEDRRSVEFTFESLGPEYPAARKGAVGG